MRQFLNLRLGLGIQYLTGLLSSFLSLFADKLIGVWFYRNEETVTEIVNALGYQDRAAVGGQVFPGKAHAFNGVNQFSYANTTDLDIADAAEIFIISGFVKLNVYDTGETVNTFFGKYSTAGYNGSYAFRAYNVGGYVSFLVHDGVWRIINTPIAYNDYNEHHYLAKVDLVNRRIYVYVDGVLINAGGTAYVNALTKLNQPFTLATSSDNNTRFADCRIRDLRIYHKDVTAQINELIAGEALGDEIAWWFCEENSTTVTYDSSGNAHHLTNVGFNDTSFVEGNWQSLMNKYGYNLI